MLFLVSALKTGTASVCFIGCFIMGMKGMSREKVETNKFVIHSVDFFLMILSMITIILFIFGLYTVSRNSAEAAKLIMGGEYTLFWGLAVVVGILVPFCLEIYELLPHFVDHTALREHNPWISGVTTVAVLAEVCASVCDRLCRAGNFIYHILMPYLVYLVFHCLSCTVRRTQRLQSFILCG